MLVAHNGFAKVVWNIDWWLISYPGVKIYSQSKEGINRIEVIQCTTIAHNNSIGIVSIVRRLILTVRYMLSTMNGTVSAASFTRANDLIPGLSIENVKVAQEDK